MTTESANIAELLGTTLAAVENTGEEVRFTTVEGDVYTLYHDQDCCESVAVEDITGNLDDLVGSPITMADESSSTDWPADRVRPEYTDSATWTFYKFATIKGYVDIRWLGQSNGYYSESVSCKVKRANPGLPL